MGPRRTIALVFGFLLAVYEYTCLVLHELQGGMGYLSILMWIKEHYS